MQSDPGVGEANGAERSEAPRAGGPAGIANIVVGAALAVGGATGELVFFGTDSSTATIAIGAVIAAIGVIQLVREARRR
jgi:hypothetical protein